jgi:hypothetical protein
MNEEAKYEIINHGSEHIDPMLMDVLCPECYSSELQNVYAQYGLVDTVGVVNDIYYNSYQLHCNKCGCDFRVCKKYSGKHKDAVMFVKNTPKKTIMQRIMESKYRTLIFGIVGLVVTSVFGVLYLPLGISGVFISSIVIMAGVTKL